MKGLSVKELKAVPVTDFPSCSTHEQVFAAEMLAVRHRSACVAEVLAPAPEARDFAFAREADFVLVEKIDGVSFSHSYGSLKKKKRTKGGNK